MFEQTFKNIDDKLWKDAGCGSELDYVEQTSWVLFLKYLDDLEQTREQYAALGGTTYKMILQPEFRWKTWAAPKDATGKIDLNKALTGDDLIDFVNNKLFPYLRQFKTGAQSADTIEYKIGEIFTEIKNKVQSGYNLREVINLVDELRFMTNAENMRCRRCTKTRSRTWATPGATVASITPRVLLSVPSSKWWRRKSESASMTAQWGRQAFWWKALTT